MEEVAMLDPHPKILLDIRNFGDPKLPICGKGMRRVPGLPGLSDIVPFPVEFCEYKFWANTLDIGEFPAMLAEDLQPFTERLSSRNTQSLSNDTANLLSPSKMQFEGGRNDNWFINLDYLEVDVIGTSLGSTESFLPRFQLPPPEENFEVQHMKQTASGGDCFNSPFGLATVLLGREPELEVEACRAPNHIFQSSNITGDTPEVEVLVLTLATMALLQELRTLDLLSMMLEQSAGLLSKKLPRAAEFKES
ncbi:hypothetical protein Tco_0299021 [Tanacetum coccineum]